MSELFASAGFKRTLREKLYNDFRFRLKPNEGLTLVDADRLIELIYQEMDEQDAVVIGRVDGTEADHGTEVFLTGDLEVQPRSSGSADWWVWVGERVHANVRKALLPLAIWVRVE